MTHIHFPNALTEEEETLKQALARLKKKKKTVQSMKAAALNQEKESVHAKNSSKPNPAPSSSSAGKATEQAKKLVQSGAIKVAELKEKSGFKRSKNFEKKLKDSDKNTPPVGFQPFMSFTGEEDDDKQPAAKRIRGLSETFVSAGYNREYGGRGYSDRPEREQREPPKRGNTVYVHGVGITEDLLKKSFSNFGNIVNISMETDRNNAFVTFEKMESADQAISEANGSIVNHTQLRVQMARRQPSFDTVADRTSTSSWASIAASSSQKGSTHKDKREMVTYDSSDIF